MKEVIKVIRAWDDFAHHNGGQVPATEEVYLRIIHRDAEGKVVRDEETELDLSAQHVGSLEASVSPWFSAGHAPGPGWIRRSSGKAPDSSAAKPGKQSAIDRAMAGMNLTARREFLGGLRAWAKDQGRESEITGDAGSPYYRKSLVTDYLAYLATWDKPSPE